ncbi:hypothetical protein [Celeribacter halophilus]|uniref:hypothetical protein n=1 Tax=Celeribacter halophilus TaxID=576117 RepID=UPI003A8C8E2B
METLTRTSAVFIICASGGNSLDVSKLVEWVLGCAFVPFPTVASNDSLTSQSMPRSLWNVPSVADALNGYQVVCGRFVQFEFDGRSPDFITDRGAFHRLAGLQLTLPTMAGDTRHNNTIKIVPEVWVESEHMGKFNRNVCVEDISDEIYCSEAA